MTEKLSNSDLRRYAMFGAEARLVELDKEAASIYQAFPELRKQRGARTAPATTGVVATRAGQRRRRSMTAAQREEVRQRMKRYWAQRRSANAAAGESAGAAKETATGRKSK